MKLSTLLVALAALVAAVNATQDLIVLDCGGRVRLGREREAGGVVQGRISADIFFVFLYIFFLVRFVVAARAWCCRRVP